MDISSRRIKLIIWGIGNHWQKIKKFIICDNIEIVAVVDNRKDIDCVVINNKAFPIISPKKIPEYAYDFVLITSTYVENIKKELLNLGVSEHQIIEDIFSEKGQKFLNEKALLLYLRDKLDIVERKQNQLYQKIDLVLAQNGRLWSNNIKNATNVKRLEEVGFKVFSQWDEDGIIQYLVGKIPIQNKTFIEFGVENYEEANTRFLLVNNNWSGMIIDGSRENIAHVCSSSIMWQRNLNAIAKFITKDNINELLLQSGFDKDLGLLSVDIDGNDYWIFKEIEVMCPRILILEYNSIWGGEKKVTIPYDETFVRGEKHYSHLYYGMSFVAAIDLAKQKGYTYVGSNCQNSNAFFVRNDLTQYFELSDMDNSWQMSNVRESRDEKGNLTYLNSKEGIELIKNMDIYDISIGEVKKIYELYQ